MFRSMLQRVEEKTLEINVCDNIIDCIRSSNPLFRNAYWRGLTLRLEHRIGLDVKLESGTQSSFIILGLQFKRPKEKRYDHIRRRKYYRFTINDNSANDQHLFLWMLSKLVHRTFTNKFVFIGYSFPLFLYHYELAQHSPNFLQRTVFIDAMHFPASKLDRLEHSVYIYENPLTVEVESNEKIGISKNHVQTGEEIIEKVGTIGEEKLLKINDLSKINRYHVNQVIKELEKENISPEIIEHIRRRIDKGWQITISTTLVPPKEQKKTHLENFL